MASITTLVPDIYELVSSKGGWENVCWEKIASSLASATNQAPRTPGLRLSGMGDRCHRALWYSVHRPELAEALPPYAQIKYIYGHIIEALVIELAKAAGHRVEGEQDEITLDGVLGHRDCVIDGAIVDVKSSSSMGFKKFKDKTLAQDDSFGYLDQLDGYVVGSVLANDPVVTEKEKGYILAVDKTLGHMVTYEHFARERSIRERIRIYKEVIRQPHAPDCMCSTQKEEGSGNIKLSTKASYSPYRKLCFPELRTFLNTKGQPVEYAKVVKIPSYQGQQFKELH